MSTRQISNRLKRIEMADGRIGARMSAMSLALAEALTMLTDDELEALRSRIADEPGAALATVLNPEALAVVEARLTLLRPDSPHEPVNDATVLDG